MDSFYSGLDLPTSQSASYRLSFGQKVIGITLLLVAFFGLFYDWRLTFIIILGLLTSLYFTDLLFNSFLVLRIFRKSSEMNISQREIEILSDDKLPNYTILCPLYKEWRVLNQFIRAMSQIDYPTDKLQILLLLEEDDVKTIQKAQTMTLPSNFEIKIIPHSIPKTKPKALNYGILRASGDFIVVYDAEDIPERDQLKKVILAFRKGGRDLKCVQAKLNFYNPTQNILTRIFTAEYSLWFDLVLTGLQSIEAPIPLGGTSNHFRTKDILAMKGWDAFNVTEDADLGIRIAKYGYKTAIVNSTTYEEANSSLKNWLTQRTRWIKGYLQTYFVHMRRPLEFIHNRDFAGFVFFQIIVGGKVLSMLVNPIMWIITATYFVARPQLGASIESFFPMPVFYMGLFAFVFGNFMYMYNYMIGCAKRKQYQLIKYVFLVPFYWVAMSASSYLAIHELIRNPHYWSKTKHGLHIIKN